jgi:hypothetical protein
MSKQVTKKKGRLTIVDNYPRLLTDIKQRIRTAQVRTAVAGNAIRARMEPRRPFSPDPKPRP